MLISKTSRLAALIAGAVVCFLTIGSAAAQKGRFASFYTNLKTDCRAAIKTKKGDEPQGDDMPLKCKGYGGYEIRIDYSAASSSLRIQPLHGGSAQAINLGMQPLDYDLRRKIEWRLAHGRPFAVIYRVDKSSSDQPEETWRPENKTGESLMVKGLKGYEQIDFEVDTKMPNANVKAREMADSAYAKKPQANSHSLSQRN